MAKKIQMYQLYDETIEELVQISSTLQFYYLDGSNEKQLLLHDEDYEYKTLLRNEEDSWDFVECGFGLQGELVIGNPAGFFGPGQLAQADAELGIALQWVSKQSLQRAIVPLVTISCTTVPNVHVPLDYYFEKHQLFGEVEICFVLYLKKASTQPVLGQARMSGTILGEIEEWHIILDGSGSTFPIVIMYEPEKPLWYVDFNYSEPLVEPFDKEYIAIYLNSAHPAFPNIQKPKTKLDQALYIEFLAGALQLIIQDLMQSPDWQDIQDGRNCEDGSIGQVMHYLKKTLEWDLDKPEKLAMSLRKDLKSKVKVGEM